MNQRWHKLLRIMSFGISCGIVLTVLVVVFFYIGETIKARSDNIASKTSASSTQNYGEYYLFETTKPEEYLEFLEKFDEEKYEIVDISTSLNVYLDGSDEFYMVTYKKIT